MVVEKIWSILKKNYEFNANPSMVVEEIYEFSMVVENVTLFE
jgi:hypothetical protein